VTMVPELPAAKEEAAGVSPVQPPAEDQKIVDITPKSLIDGAAIVIPSNRKEAVKTYAKAMARLYRTFGEEPPRIGEETSKKKAESLARKLGLNAEHAKAFTPLEFSLLDEEEIQKCVASVSDPKQQAIVNESIRQVNESAGYLSQSLHKSSEHGKLQRCGEVLVATVGSKKAMLLDGGDIPIRRERDVDALLSGKLDLGAKLQTYLRQISPAVQAVKQETMNRGRKRFKDNLELEPELKQFMAAYDAMQQIRRNLGALYDVNVNGLPSSHALRSDAAIGK